MLNATNLFCVRENCFCRCCCVFIYCEPSSSSFSHPIFVSFGFIGCLWPAFQPFIRITWSLMLFLHIVSQTLSWQRSVYSSFRQHISLIKILGTKCCDILHFKRNQAHISTDERRINLVSPIRTVKNGFVTKYSMFPIFLCSLHLVAYLQPISYRATYEKNSFPKAEMRMYIVYIGPINRKIRE